MSYCVNCGVELAPKAKSCPLCGVQVFNPLDKGEGEALYPAHHGGGKKEHYHPSKMLIKVYTASLALPLLLTFSLDLLLSHAITWSYYTVLSILLFWVLTVPPFILKKNFAFNIITIDTFSIAAFLLLLDLYGGEVGWAWYATTSLVLFWVLAGLPILFRKYGAFLAIAVDGIAIAGYLRFMEIYTQSGPWFFSLALPIVVLLTVLVLGIITLTYLKKLKGYAITGASFAAASFLCLGVDFFVKHFLGEANFVGWSLIVAITCLPVAGLFFILQRDMELQTLLHKKFHI